jgi:hypothetical protein
MRWRRRYFRMGERIKETGKNVKLDMRGESREEEMKRFNRV